MKRVGKGLALGLAMLCAMAASAQAGYRLGLREANRARPALAAEVPEAEDPLKRFRTEREQLRQRQYAQLNDIIHDPASDAETLRLAQRRLLCALETEALELRLEGLLESRGFEGALVDAGEAAVSVMVRVESLTRQETAVILDTVLRETGLTGGNVKIIPVN